MVQNIKKIFNKQGFVRLKGVLDYKEDFEFFKKLYSLIDIRTTTKEIIEFLEENPNISEINFHKQADFIKNQEKFNNSVKI